MKNKVLFDIDGCIINMEKRWAAWKAGELTPKLYKGLAMAMDEPIPAGVALYKALLANPDLDCIFVTARNEEQRAPTHAQLVQLFGLHDLDQFELLMRPDGESYEADTKLKILRRNRITPDQVLFAIDDDPSMIASYQAWGITTYQASGTKP